MTKVLFVEDDINLREIYAARLSADGYTVIVASDGEEALAKAVQEKPDLIVLDVMMPKISGFDVLDIIRSTPEIKDSKVVLLTALSQENDRQRAEKLGAASYLVKSQITLEDVVEAIKSTVGTPGPTSDSPTNDDTSSDNTPKDDTATADQNATVHDVATQATPKTPKEAPEEIESEVQSMLTKKAPKLDTKMSSDISPPAKADASKSISQKKAA